MCLELFFPSISPLSPFHSSLASWPMRNPEGFKKKMLGWREHLNSVPLHWEHWVLATGLQGSPMYTFLLLFSRKELCLVTQLCLTLCDPMDCSPPGSSVHGDCPGKNTRVGCHALLQGIFLTRESNWGLLHCRWFLYQLIYQWWGGGGGAKMEDSPFACVHIATHHSGLFFSIALGSKV